MCPHMTPKSIVFRHVGTRDGTLIIEILPPDQVEDQDDSVPMSEVNIS